MSLHFLKNVTECSVVGSVSVLGTEGHMFESYHSDNFMNYLHSFLILTLILSGFLVFFSENPVHSVLFLILCFCEASSILFLFSTEFLGLLFIIVYVGAIAVLFLFVVMMLNVKLYVLQTVFYLPLVFVIGGLIFSQLTLLLKKSFFNLNFDDLQPDIIFFDILNNIDVFGQVLYNNFLSCFLLAGLILLCAMIGAIVLTLNFKSYRKNELVFRQLSSSEKTIFHFK